jgi:hypothetical protein
MLAFQIMHDIHRHMDAEDLERYSMGTSSEEETALFEEHLLTCEGCQDRLRETDDYLLAMRAVAQQRRREERSGEGRRWKFPVWFPALAAAVCVLLLVVGAARYMQSPGTAVAVSLTAMRGSGAGNGAPAGRDLVLHPDLTGLAESSSYRLEIVDQTGRPVRQSPLARTQSGVRISRLDAGLYFVRVYLPAGDLLREYGLEIR